MLDALNSPLTLANTVTLGGVDIGSNTLKYDVDGSMDMVQIHSEVLNENQVKDLHKYL